MKLRIRALGSSETLQIDVPGDSSLSQLQQAIADEIIFASPSSLRLSLNRTDVLHASASGDSLAALGIASGDLIFYYFSAETRDVAGRRVVAEASDSDSVSTDYDSMEEGSEEGDVDEDMQIGDGSGRFPESCFMKRLVSVFRKESRYEGFSGRLIALSVHSVLLESGFVRFDSASGKRIDDDVGSSLSTASTMSLNYTLPAILEEDETPSVIVKFTKMEPFVNVFASLDNGGSGAATYRIYLSEHKFSPAIFMLAIGNDDLEKDLHELWKTVRDEVALPLMIDLCAKAGLAGPACLLRLPSELQMKILELLPGDDIARASCTCKELRSLAQNNELWKRKFAAEFGTLKWWASWKAAFGEFRRRKRRADAEELAASRRRASRVWNGPRLFPPFLGIHPPIRVELSRIGGVDFERLPGPGLFLPPFGLRNQNRNRLARIPFPCRF